MSAPHPHDKVVAIVQARLGSSRLPLKSLLCLRDVPLIDWVVRRLKTPRFEVVSPSPAVSSVGTPVVSVQDVLARFCLAARQADAGLVVRVCADNPLIWGEAVDRLVDFYRAGRWDYAYNHIPRNNLWPDGLGAEILSRELLDALDAQARQTAQREHCPNYLWDNAARFRLGTFNPTEPWLQRPDLKLDVDQPQDFQRLALLPLHPDVDACDGER